MQAACVNLHLEIRSIQPICLRCKEIRNTIKHRTVGPGQPTRQRIAEAFSAHKKLSPGIDEGRTSRWDTLSLPATPAEGTISVAELARHDIIDD